jgi:hypothetical protein
MELAHANEPSRVLEPTGKSSQSLIVRLLQEAGYRYVMDWTMDDQPIWLRTRKGDPRAAVPDRGERHAPPAISAAGPSQ